MKALVQRVLEASVSVDGVISGSLESGLLVYLGVARDDTEEDAAKLAEKIAHLRIFNDAEGRMNRSLLELNVQDPAAGVLAVSQFTLLADARRGRRPYYGGAAEPDIARSLYEYFIGKIRGLGLPCANGVFQASMKVRYTNDGPVTIILDSKDL